MFLLAMLALWTVAEATVLGGARNFAKGLVYAVLFGMAFGYWAVGALAFLDRLSRRAASGLAARGLFLILAASALLLLWSIIAFGPGHPSNKQMLYEWGGFLMLGVPLMLVATFYFLRPRPRT